MPAMARFSTQTHTYSSDLTFDDERVGWSAEVTVPEEITDESDVMECTLTVCARTVEELRTQVREFLDMIR